MGKIIEEKNLKQLNTFGVSCIAAEYCEIDSIEELRDHLGKSEEVFILGGGSNLLLPETLDKRILHNRIAGISSIVSGNKVMVEAGGGVNWHELVSWTVDQNLGGIENLALIPGTVGAAPIQNIGAYGVELRDVFDSLDAVDLDTGEIRTFDNQQCQFGYRDSIFKNEYKGRYFIARVRLVLAPEDRHQVNVDYRSLSDHLEKAGIRDPGIREVFDAVVDIRRSKLPDPEEIGNSGSFFKNAVVSEEVFQQLRNRYSDLVFYENPDGTYKIPTGWLIEKCGWKGKYVGEVGCYEKQALVLVNKGNATATEVRALAERIINDVKNEFGIVITPEVNVL